MLSFPVKQFIMIAVLAGSLMILIDYGLPQAQPDYFFLGATGNQPTMLFINDLPYINSTTLGELSAVGIIFSYLFLRNRHDNKKHKMQHEIAEGDRPK